MTLNRAITLICLILGAIVAIYAKANEQQNNLVLIAGIVLLMIGVYRISKNISSKQVIEDESPSLSPQSRETEQENEV